MLADRPCGGDQRLEAAIPERVTLRGWRDMAQGLVASLLAPAPALPEPVACLHFPMGHHIGFEAPVIPDLPALPEPGVLLHQLLCEGEGWGLQERWGIWAMQGPRACACRCTRPPLARLR